MRSTIRNFLRLESAGGILLIAAALLALIIANTPLSRFYDLLLAVPVEIRIGGLLIAKPLLLWINDGLMAVFFFLVGMELKRELIDGELSEPSSIVLPVVAAIGGILVPVLVYSLFNWGNAEDMQGWAVPAATDIAFALGILTLLGDRIPVSLKVFLVSLAIVDDIGAIVIIGVFYSSDLSLTALVVASVCVIALAAMNARGVTQVSSYVLLGVIMWVALLKSGVHATLTGVVLALFIPLRDASNPDRSPLRELEDDLHHIVAFFILPVFAFANSGISFAATSLDQVTHPVTLGIIAGLFVGKQVGVFGLAWVSIKLGIARLPDGSSWRGLYGASVLSGIGFTMSLFIGSLAFERTGIDHPVDERIGILIASVGAGLFGYLILRGLPRERAESG